MQKFSRERIVVPIDFSEDSAAAVATAVELAGAPQNVHVIHVLYPMNLIASGEMWSGPSDSQRENEIRSRMSEFLSARGVTGVTATVRTGDPGLVVTDYASDVKADLIVVPSHGYHGVKRFVLGSVAERIIRHAACSVLVLRRSDAE